MKKLLSLSVFTATALSLSNLAHATNYTYELSQSQTWADAGSASTTTQYVSVRSYVPGSNYTTYKTIPLYTRSYSSEANALGDVVGSVFHIYGRGTTAFADPYNGPKRTVIYPATQILHTRLSAVNDDRLAIGSYNVLGGHARGRGFIYDIIYDQYTDIMAPDTEWTAIGGFNNLGQIVGASINDDGASRTGFVYDCNNGFEAFHIPGASWSSVPRKIDDQGNIYGSVSGIADATYFIARPDVVADNSNCSLVPRDDVAEPVIFSTGESVELSGDFAQGVKIADFDGGGVNDLLVYHGIGKTILYLGETGFTDKIKYYGDEFNTLAAGVVLESEWDFNNDGLTDKLTNNAMGNALHLAKADGSYYYVPQQLPSGNLKFGDLNADGRVDYVTFNGAYVTFAYQDTQATTAPVTEPVVDPVVEPVVEPVAEPTPVADSTAPIVDAYATKVEMSDTIAEFTTDGLLLSSGSDLQFNTDSIIKLNDASAFEIGQTLDFKAWMNPDGTLIGIKVEVAS